MRVSIDSVEMVTVSGSVNVFRKSPKVIKLSRTLGLSPYTVVVSIRIAEAES